MAEIQDIDSDIGEFESVVEQTTKESDGKVDLPEKYRGKTVDDVVKMHQEAEKLIERQGREVGEVRRLADELLKSQLTPKAKVEEKTEIDFFENPQEAIRQQIENNPRVIAAEQYAKQIQAEQSKQKLAQLHPDVSQVLGDSEFHTWVKASKVREQLFKQADSYDLDAADELLSTFKELKAARSLRENVAEKTTRTQALKSASVDAGGSGESGQKIYRRSDLIRLKMRDPAKYESMSDEIMAAYSSGRVK